MNEPATRPFRPAQQPCRTCSHFQADGWCRALAAWVQPGWTGCIRWLPKPDPEPEPEETP